MPFTTKSEDRIDDAVRDVERMVGNPQARRRRWHTHPENDGAKRWGKLDADVDEGATDAVVSLWQKTGGGWDGWDEDSTENKEDVYAPPWLEARGTTYTARLRSDSWVLIERINGRWVIVHCYETRTMVIGVGIDGANKEFRKKTQDVLVASADSITGWIEYHTGDDCP